MWPLGYNPGAGDPLPHGVLRLRCSRQCLIRELPRHAHVRFLTREEFVEAVRLLALSAEVAVQVNLGDFSIQQLEKGSVETRIEYCSYRLMSNDSMMHSHSPSSSSIVKCGRCEKRPVRSGIIFMISSHLSPSFALKLAPEGAVGGGHLLLVRFARLNIGRHPLRPEIEYVALHLQHLGELFEQVIGRLAAIVF
jgi:hypothetical protein